MPIRMVCRDPSSMCIDDLVLRGTVGDTQNDVRIEVARAPMFERSPELLALPIRSAVGHVSVVAQCLLQRSKILLHRGICWRVVFAGADVFGEDLFFDVCFDTFVFFDPHDGFFGEP